MTIRRRGRILAFQALYAWEACSNSDAGEKSIDSAFAWLDDTQDQLDENIAHFSRILVAGTIENIRAIDAMIQSHLQNWDFSRVQRVDLALLRMSTYALMYQADIAPSIVINEAVGIAQVYGTDDSYRFINGMLDSIRKTLEKTAESAAGA
ncbi:MAG: transcription antitermination factor NusB [Treponema sp.]|jgi:N utilization substance protein B|nr:transcription antitermination factor NusB [Treponema sp.]